MTASKSSKPTAAVLLGAVHRGVGLADQVLGGARQVHRDRDPDAGGDELLARAERERPGERRGHALGDADRQLRVLEVVADDAELVTAEAGDRVAGAQALDQPRGEHAQELVAGTVAERVVDELEAVEVDEQHRDRGAAPGGLVER
jgi:hypothetical protein